MTFLLLLFIPLIVCAFSFIFGKGKITFNELLIQLAVQLVIVGMSVGIIYQMNVTDVEIWSGKVTSKKREEVHCRHSYRCHCVEVCTGSGEDESCHEVCQTCYDHTYDVDWKVYTNIEHTYYIDTLDRQGLKEPPRWTRAYIGEPIALQKLFNNYIKGSKGTLFKYQGFVDKYKNNLPIYPSKIYDYYYLDRFVQVGMKLDPKPWNSDLMSVNGDLGKSKKSNIIIVLVNDLAHDYFYALQQHWLGGKKNDIILVISVKDDIIKWVDVMSWAEKDIFNIKLRDSILDIEQLDRNKIIKELRENTDKYFIKKSFEEYAYLKSRISPSPLQLAISSIIGFLCSIGLSIYFYKTNVA